MGKLTYGGLEKRLGICEKVIAGHESERNNRKIRKLSSTSSP